MTMARLVFLLGLAAHSASAQFDNCASCPQTNPYQKQCQNPYQPLACFPRMSNDVCPPGTDPCAPYSCPDHSWPTAKDPKDLKDCTCEWGYHPVYDNQTCVKNATKVGFTVPRFASKAPLALNCTCAIRSSGYECRDPRSLACYSKLGGICPGGTEELPNCCGHCAAGSSGKLCQDTKNLVCYPLGGTGQCPAGTLKCPTSSGNGTNTSTPCQKDYTLCAKLGAGAYCGASGDPDAYDSATGCSCGWNSHFSKSTGKCAPGTCNGLCQSDAATPCLGLNAPVCFGLLSNNACPPGTKDCRFKLGSADKTTPGAVRILN